MPRPRPPIAWLMVALVALAPAATLAQASLEHCQALLTRLAPKAGTGTVADAEMCRMFRTCEPMIRDVDRQAAGLVPDGVSLWQEFQKAKQLFCTPSADAAPSRSAPTRSGPGDCQGELFVARRGAAAQPNAVMCQRMRRCEAAAGPDLRQRYQHMRQQLCAGIALPSATDTPGAGRSTPDADRERRREQERIREEERRIRENARDRDRRQDRRDADWSRIDTAEEDRLNAAREAAATRRAARDAARAHDDDPAPAPTATPPDPFVRTLQGVLAGCGFNAGAADGLWGPRTAAAAAAFVRAHGGTPSGDRATLTIQVDSFRVGDAGPCPAPATTESSPCRGADCDRVCWGDECHNLNDPVTATPVGPAPGADVAQVTRMLAARDDPDANPLDLSGRDLSGGSFVGQDFGRDNLTDTDFSGADVSDGDFTDTILERTNFTNTKADRAKFPWKDMRKTITRGMRAVGANFTGANFAGMTGQALNISNGVLDLADLTNFNARGTVMDKVSMWGARIDGLRGGPDTGLAVDQLVAATGSFLRAPAHVVERVKAAKNILSAKMKEGLEDFKDVSARAISLDLEDDGNYIVRTGKYFKDE